MPGPSLAAMAWRNLWRNRRRTGLTLLSIAFGGFLAVIMTAMQDRSFSDFIDTAARMGGGHVTVMHREYQRKRSSLHSLPSSEQLAAIASAQPGVAHTAVRITGQAMLSTARDSHGAFFIAVAPSRESERSFQLWDALVQGEAFADDNERGIVLGERLADKLGVKLGKKVIYTMMDKHGEVVAGMGRLTGTIRTGVPSVDNGLCLLPLAAVRGLLGYGANEATQVAVFLDDSRDADEVATRLGPILDDPAVALTWDQAQPQLSSFIAMKIGGGRVFQILVTILVAAGIFNTMFVSVMERLREFGILMAIGFSPGRLFRLVMWEAWWLGLVGLVTSAALTIGPYLYLSTHGIDYSEMLGGQTTEVAGVGFDSVMRVGIYPESLAVIAIAIVAATLLSGLYPAVRAGRVVPVESIRLV